MIHGAAGGGADQAIHRLALVGLGADLVAGSIGDHGEAQAAVISDDMDPVHTLLAAAGLTPAAIAALAVPQAAVEAGHLGKTCLADQIAQGLDGGDGSAFNLLKQGQVADSGLHAGLQQGPVGPPQGLQQAACSGFDGQAGKTGADQQGGDCESFRVATDRPRTAVP